MPPGGLSKLRPLDSRHRQPIRIVLLYVCWSVENGRRNNPLVVKFVQDMTYEPPSLLELSGRTIKIEKVKYNKADLPKNLLQYLDSCQRCVNPKCKGNC